MAARRLIAVMLVLLFLSSLAAALAPVERQRDESSTTSTAEVFPAALAGGELVHRKLAADPKDPPRIEAAVGDQLQLRVTSKRPATLELVGLGPTEDVDSAAGALRRPARPEGHVPIRALETGKVVGRIRVSPRVRTESAPGQDRSRS